MLYFTLALMQASAPLVAASGGAVYAGDPSSEDLRAAASSEAWRKLVHYEPSALGTGAWSSDVLGTDFFFSDDGRNDPLSELRATMDAMRAPVGEDPNSHAQCRFPARFIWLERTLWADEKIDEVQCSAYSNWLGYEPIKGASLVFVSGHLENPSSFYGHLMLRLNTEFRGHADPNQLLGRALNHGAIYPDNENPVAYIFNGLTGGYPATFSEMSYFNHEHEWTEEELRDAWEYELDLTDEQLELLVAHAWEMRNARVPYFFLKQNCGYRIAEILSVVLDGTLLPSDKPWSMPVDVLDAASTFDNAGKPLVRTTRLMASRQTMFRERYRDLSATEQGLVRAFIASPNPDAEMSVATLALPRQAAVLETLVDYYNMDQARGAQTDDGRERRNALLVARMQRPAGGTPVTLDRSDPNEGNKSSLLQLSAVHNSERGDMLQLRLRGAYNDFLTQSPGSLPYSELTLGDVRVDISDDGLVLRQAEILRITTLSLSETGLPDDGGMAWRLRFGVEQDALDCDDCLVGYVEAGAGAAAELGGGFVAYGLAGGRAAAPDRQDGVAQVGFVAGLITDPTQSIRASVEAGVWHDLDGDGRSRPFVMAEARFGNSPEWDFGLSARYEESTRGDAFEVRASISHYW